MAKTPMMMQYLQVKEQYPDAILFYRLGDFYEMFFDDAKTVSRELELTLTGRDCGEAERAPMCGVPYHSAETYIGRLVSRGYKVVVCEQMEDPATAKGIVKREVVRIVTPGTVMGNNLPSEKKNNYLCSVCVDTTGTAVCFCDISTGEMSATFFEGSDMNAVVNELGAFSPSEAIVNVSLCDIPQISEFLTHRIHAFVTDMAKNYFKSDDAQKQLGTLFTPDKTAILTENKPLCSCVIALINYICDTQKTDFSYIKNLDIYNRGQFLEMDVSTRRNLELTETMRTKEKRGSLLWVLDKTRTSMGARMLHKWIEQPLVNPNAIYERQSAVEELVKNTLLRGELDEILKDIKDLERLTGKLVYGSAGGRDLRAVSSTLALIPQIKELLCDTKCAELNDIYSNIDNLSDICSLICNAIVEEPPFSIREGGFIKKGYCEELDKYIDILENGDSLLSNIEVTERQKTGIPKLKVGYNHVFGYYIEVTKLYSDKVPENYIRKQTLANCERYITSELKALESEMLGACEKRNALEYNLFMQVCRNIIGDGNLERIQKTAVNIAKLDVYNCLAEVAFKSNYVRPEVEYGDVISIKEGRHPVVEKFTDNSWFVPNDTLLDREHNRMMLITGPNMAGKSTYMRQVALITIMAQIGSFVPCGEARIGICDKIFTRVGASDDLAQGQSTFMLEMTEVANILKNATGRSLIIYDEIGRGTSTYDGMSIAKAVVEYTVGKKLGAKSLFATHYHELTDLEGKLDGVVNYNIAAKKKGEEIIFLRKIVRGATDDSYGIEVAQLAGVPREVIKNAKSALNEIEAQGLRVVDKTEAKKDANITIEDLAADEIIHKLKNTDVNLLTPIEAMNLLVDLKKLL